MAIHISRAHRSTSVLFCLLAAIGYTAPAALAAGTPGAGCGDLTLEGQSVGEAAAAYHAEGIGFKESAWTKESAALAAPSDTERDRLLAAAQADYQAAIAAQGKALKLHLAYYQAANELGYALRKTGDFRKALGAYNFALQINPEFYPAIEYRGEAYLALGMIDQAKSAYMTLFRNDPGLAGELLSEMEATAAANGPSDLVDWVAERKTLAALTPLQSDSARQDW